MLEEGPQAREAARVAIVGSLDRFLERFLDVYMEDKDLARNTRRALSNITREISVQLVARRS